MKVVLCFLGYHDWDGCQCRRCNERKSIYDSAHDWDGCQCRKCGLTNREAEKSQHDWDGCECRKCGLTDKEAAESQHKWIDCECRRCHATRHQWSYESDSGFDRRGGQSYDTHERRVWTSETRTCTVCGKKESDYREEIIEG